MQNVESMHKAMNAAIASIQEIYKDEDIDDIEVEEIEREPGELEPSGDWLITVGFTRQKPRKALGGLALPQRNLKVVRIDPYSNQFKGMTIRSPST